MFRRGSPVVYCASKHSASPGPRARENQPAAKGETYTYVVDNLWAVADVKDDGKLLLITRNGIEHVVDADDPRLRHTTWWDRLIYRNRFSQVDHVSGRDSRRSKMAMKCTEGRGRKSQ